MKNRKRILVLVHQALIPPNKTTAQEKSTAPWRTEYDVVRGLRQLGHEVKVVGLLSDLGVLRQALYAFRPHVVFNLLEEFDGAALFDQHVVAYLELLRQPYTGCGPRGLLLARDKGLSKSILAHHRIPVPRFSVAPLGKKFRLPAQPRFPVIVKSLTEEGSWGISQASVVNDAERLKERIEFIHANLQSDAIVEQYLAGREFYVGILGNKRLTVLPPLELTFKNAPETLHKIATSRVKWNAEYRAKYGIDTHVVCDLSAEQLKDLERLCRRTYKALQLDGYARIDLRRDQEGRFYVIEANPNPDISEDEDFATSALHAGWSYNQLLEQLVNIGLRKSK